MYETAQHREWLAGELVRRVRVSAANKFAGQRILGK
jgi:hypothetical protein